MSRAEARSRTSTVSGLKQDHVKTISAAALSIKRFKDPVFLKELIGDARCVLIGEATHGTADFYDMRAEITKVLLEHCDFNFVAMEADWPDMYRVHRYVMGKGNDKTGDHALSDFARFPTWMWRNTSMLNFVEWLKDYNDKQQDPVQKKGTYGLDMYSLFTSIDAVLSYLHSVGDKEAAAKAEERYAVMKDFEEAHEYALACLHGIVRSQQANVNKVLIDILSKAPQYVKDNGGWCDGDEFMWGKENARVVKDAEEYYRNSFRGGHVTWNIRDKHMFDTLLALHKHYGEKLGGLPSRSVVWAHNSHLGDARATEKSHRDELNLGQLVRASEEFGLKGSFDIGFTTYDGTVSAATRWGGTRNTMVVNKALPESIESVLHDVSNDLEAKNLARDYALILRCNNEPHDVHAKDALPFDDVLRLLKPHRLERFIGVQYVKATERQSHYQSSSLTNQFDAVLHIDTTNALQPLGEVPPAESASTSPLAAAGVRRNRGD